MRKSIILVWFFLPLTVSGQTAEIEKVVQEKLQTIKYVKSLQQKDGGFRPEQPNPSRDFYTYSSLRATSSGIRVLTYLGAEIPKKEKVTEFVKSCFDPKTGSFGDRPDGKGDIALTAVGLMAIAELKLKVEDYATTAVPYLRKNAKGFEEIRIAAAGLEAVKQFPDGVQDWLDEVKKLRNDDGTYGKGDGKARMTGGAVALILRVGSSVTPEDRKSILETLHQGQQADGGYRKEEAKGSDLETTYRVMRCFHLLQEKPGDMNKLRSFVSKCRNPDGGYGVIPEQKSSISGTYYASVITKWIAEMEKLEKH